MEKRAQTKKKRQKQGLEGQGSFKHWEPARPLQRPLRPFGPKCRKSLEKVSGPGTPKNLQKVSGTVWDFSGESPESVKRVFSDCSRDFSDGFRDSGARGPSRHFRDIFETFSRHFRHFGPKGPERPLKGAHWFPIQAGEQDKRKSPQKAMPGTEIQPVPADFGFSYSPTPSSTQPPPPTPLLDGVDFGRSISS